MQVSVTNSNADQRPNAATPLTDDAFLGGLVQVWQPAEGFRAGMDSVTLAAAIPARPREHVCDLGAGVATASLCLAARVKGLHLTAVEIDEGLADLARANAARNKATMEVIVADVLKRPRTIARQRFHHVLTNPPFHDARSTRAPLPSKAAATSAHTSELVAWLRFARALVRPKGTLTAILPPDQLALALTALAPEGKGVEVVPLWPKPGEPAKRLIIRTRMNSNAPLQLHAGLVLHTAAGKPALEAEAVLRQGQALIR